MVVKEFLEDREMYNPDIESVVQEYARIKCKELLEIVAEKAKVEEKYFPNELGGRHKSVGSVDKDSILNVVDLDSFCS